MKNFIQKIFDFTAQWEKNIVSISKANFREDLKGLNVCDVLFFCHDADRPLSLKGKAFSPLVDVVRKDFESRGLNCLSIAHPWSSLIGEAAHGEPIGMNKTYFFYLIHKKLLRLLGMSQKDVNNPYSLILEKTKAKLIITIGSPILLASVARERNIFHVELLHGIGYSFLPWGWDRLPPSCLPQGVLSLDEVSTASFGQLEDKGITVHTIPHPFLKNFVGRNKELFETAFDMSFCTSADFKKQIVITFNWSRTHKDILRNAFTGSKPGPFLLLLSELVAEEKNIFWHFRLHPVQLRNPNFKYLRDFMDEFVSTNTNACWRESSQLPLPSLANFCDAHISLESMSCYDVAMLGIPSLMLSPRIHNGGIYQKKFIDLELEGFVTKGEMEKHFIRNWVCKTKKMKPRLSNLEDNSSWEEAVSWMLCESEICTIPNSQSNVP